MYNIEKNIIKFHVFREIISENVELLFERTDVIDTKIIAFNKLDRTKKNNFIVETNKIFLQYLADGDAQLFRYAYKKYKNDENLSKLIIKLIYKERNIERTLLDLSLYIYLSYFAETYFSKQGLFSKKALITGDKKLDAIISDTIRKVIIKDLYNDGLPDDELELKKMQQFATFFDDVIDKTKVSQNQPVKDLLGEGLMDRLKIERFIGAIQTIFYGINSETIAEVRATLLALNADKLKEIATGGKSNISIILSMALMSRTGKFLSKIKIANPTLDFLSLVIGNKLFKEDNGLFVQLRNNLQEHIANELQKLKQKKNFISKLAAKNANYGN